MKNTNKSEVSFLKYTTIIILFFPQFQKWVGLAFEQLLTFSVTMLLFFYFLKVKNKFPYLALYVSLIFLLLFSIDLLRSIDFLVINDFFEFIKPFSFIFYFILGYSILNDVSKGFRFFDWLMKILVIVSILAIIEAKITSLGRIISILYKDGRYVLIGKAVFSFISPYSLATVLIYPVFYYFISFFAEKKLGDFISFFICLYAMLLTQSKTVFLGFILTFIIMVVFVVFNNWLPGRKALLKFSLSFIFLVAISLPFIIVMAKSKFSYLYSGLNVFFKSFSSLDIFKVLNAQPSTKLRFEQLKFAIQSQDFIPLVGVAIGKKVLMPESFYALYLYRTGLLGMAIHIFMVFFAAKRAFSAAKFYSEHNQNKNIFKRKPCFYYSSFFFFLSLIFSYFSAAVTDQTRVAFIFYVLLGHLYSINKTNIGIKTNRYLRYKK